MDAAQRGAYLEDPPEGTPDIDQAHHVSCLQHVSLPSLRYDITCLSHTLMTLCAGVELLQPVEVDVRETQHSLSSFELPSRASMACLQAAAQEGATQPPSLDEVVVLHFVALVQKAGRLLELDGNKPFPIDHGASSPETLLQVPSAFQS